MTLTQQQSAIAGQLEATELEVGILPHDDYVRLFVIYLLNKDMCANKFLWRRIPAEMKCSAELQRMNMISQALWNQLSAEAMKLTDFNWSEGLKPVISTLKESIRKEALDIIRESYSAISVDLFQISMGTDREQAIQIAQQLDWMDDRQFIYPVSSARKAKSQKATEVLEGLSSLQLNSSNAEN
ncbi:COP9 signalosome complex subunit 8-like [Adelges cooleyi]|uniref:COP9 signalosome complex subunit 8-like n=1 Tax=Adelges cooleyi TaxID=133065 RepID=UPI00217F747C|nr:COP9 signalosome complex subunit 8-like [Adelges cooleyi]